VIPEVSRPADSPHHGRFFADDERGQRDSDARDSDAHNAGDTEPVTLRIDSVLNFRDVAGDGLALTSGDRMAGGVVVRSAS
jgi:hypothetical protein